MEIHISYEGLEITITQKPNKDQDIDKGSTKPPIESKKSELIPGIPNPLSERDKQVMDEAWEYIELLVDRGLI